MSVSTLAGTTWLINEQPVYSPLTGLEYSFSVNFNSNNESFRLFYPTGGSSFFLNYWYTTSGAIRVYTKQSAIVDPTAEGTWVNENYRTVTFIDGADISNSNLIAWFEANATQVIASNETYLTNDVDLTSVANAIRTKGGTSASLVYPAGYVSAINALPTGALQSYKSAVYTSPGTVTILPDSGYVGIEEISVEYSPSIYDGAYHRETLVGSTWLFNSWIWDTDDHWYYINFVSNGRNFTILSTTDNEIMTYRNYSVTPKVDEDVLYQDDSTYPPQDYEWVDNEYRTISITGGTDAMNSTLIAWLKANATQIS